MKITIEVNDAEFSKALKGAIKEEIDSNVKSLIRSSIDKLFNDIAKKRIEHSLKFFVEGNGLHQLIYERMKNDLTEYYTRALNDVKKTVKDVLADNLKEVESKANEIFKKKLNDLIKGE